MKRLIYSILLCTALYSKAQKINGIHFENSLSWSEILKKAKNENKSVMVDCYATWCGPCKRMDEEIYPQKEAGDYFNSKYVSVKIQMDKTNNDDSLIKKQYPVARMLTANYSVTAFPTFLFFSADGKPLHKSIGARSLNELIQLGEDAQNPEKQYYQVLKNFQPGKLDTSELKGLALSLKFTDKQLAVKIAEDYIIRIPSSELKDPTNILFIKSFDTALLKSPLIIAKLREYLFECKKDSLTEQGNLFLFDLFRSDTIIRDIATNYINDLNNRDFFKISNLLLVNSFSKIIASDDRIFKLIYNNQIKIDRITKRKNFAQHIIDAILRREIISPAFQKASSIQAEVDWTQVSNLIIKKTNNKYAKHILFDNKVDWFLKNYKRYPDSACWYFAKSVEQVEFDSLSLFNKIQVGNSIEYLILKYCNTQELLKEAIVWMEKIQLLQAPNTGLSYVYAGLLYKVGKVQEAISWQQLTLDLIELQILKQGQGNWKKFYSEQLAILEKMKKNELIDWVSDRGNAVTFDK